MINTSDNKSSKTSHSPQSRDLHLSKKGIISQALHVGGLTFLSRLLGIFREMLQTNYLGVGILSDAFITAFKIPNFLRKIFAEGALSASFVPHIVGMVKDGRKDDASSLMSAAFVVFEGMVLLLCAIVMIWPEFVIWLFSPGFDATQMAATVPMIRVLFPFIFFISSCALLTGALQSVNHFLVTALGPVLLNIVYIGGLLLCIKYNLPPLYLCFAVLLGGAVKLITRFLVYRYKNFTFGPLTRQSFSDLSIVLKRFSACLLGVGILEIHMIVDLRFASYLPVGSTTLIYYANRFLQMPLSIFAVALSTVLLPHFSRLATGSKNRLSFYLLEVSKLITWISLPVTFYLMFVSRPIFANLMLYGKGTPEQITIAAQLLLLFAIGFVFFALNRSLINIFYALKNTWTPTWITAIAALINILGNWLGIKFFGITGIVLATVIGGITTTVLFVWMLSAKHQLTIYFGPYFMFLRRYAPQAFCGMTLYIVGHHMTFHLLTKTTHSSFFMDSFGYWAVSIPLLLLMFKFLLVTRRFFGINLYFLSNTSISKV